MAYTPLRSMALFTFTYSTAQIKINTTKSCLFLKHQITSIFPVTSVFVPCSALTLMRVAGGYWPIKNSVPLIPTGSLTEQVKGELADPGSPWKWPLNRSSNSTSFSHLFSAHNPICPLQGHISHSTNTAETDEVMILSLVVHHTNSKNTSKSV